MHQRHAGSTDLYWDLAVRASGAAGLTMPVRTIPMGLAPLEVVARSYDPARGTWSAPLAVRLVPAPSAVQKFLRLAEVMSKTTGSKGDVGEFMVLTNLSPAVALDLGGVRLTCSKINDDGTLDEPKCDVTLPAGLVLAAGASLRLEQADHWPKGKITNGAVDIEISDANAQPVQTLKIDTGWDGFELTDGQGGWFAALAFGESVTKKKQWCVKSPE